MYSLYMHISPSHKVYIGVTLQRPNLRWKHGSGYVDNEYFSRAIKKYGWNNFNHIILCDNLTKEEAEFLERDMICMCKATDRRYGYNIENGGNLAGKHSPETCAKMSVAMRGEKNPRYGKKFPYQMKRMADIKDERTKQIETDRRRKSHIGQIPVNKVAVCQLSKDGQPICIYQSISEASKSTGVDVANISRALKKSGKHAGGFLWKKI